LKTTPLRIPSIACPDLSCECAARVAAPSLNKGLLIRPQRSRQSDWAGMVSASEVEEALKQRLEAKDVVGCQKYCVMHKPDAMFESRCALQTVVDDSGG